MTRVRVLQIVQNLNYGGMERLIAEMARHLDPARFEVHILALGYLGHFSNGLEIVAQLHLARPMPRWSMLRPSILAEDIGRIDPDVVHTHGGVWYKAGLAARMAGVLRVIHTDHGRHNPDPWTYRAIDGLASRRADVVVAVSEPLAEQLRRIVCRPDRVLTIQNGVDTDSYRPGPDDQLLRRDLGIAPDAPIIGSIGRLERVKGYDVMVEAFAQLSRNWTDGTRPVLVLIGDGAERATLEERRRASGLGDAIRFLGWRSDISACHRSFTLFTMSSRSEGTSVSLLEAMSAGLCPVITNVGGNAAVLGEELRHRLVPSEDPDALAEAWREALMNTERRAADAWIARERVVRDFSLGAMVRKYEALYTQPSDLYETPARLGVRC